MASSELSVMLTAKGNLENELRGARDRVKDLSTEIRKIQSTGGTVGDDLADEFRQASLAAEKLSRKVNDTNRDIKRMTSESKQASAAMGGVGKAMGKVAAAAAAFVSVQAVTQFMKDAIQQGSNLQESMSKTTVVFGKASDEIVAWSETSSTAMGLSQQSALEAVSTYGNLFQAFGITRDESAKMSQQLVQLAADLASFNNTSLEESLLAIRSGLSGETEPLKRFGIALTDARLKSEAMAMGIWDGKGALDAAQKSQAAYALIMKDSTLAQGDYARTADGYANTMKTLTAEVDNAKAEIGTQLIVAIEKAAEAFGGPEGLATMISDAGTAMADFVAGIGGAIETLGLLTNAINDVVKVGDNGLVDFFMTLDRYINPVQGLIRRTSEYGSELRQQEKAIQDSVSAAEDLYAGYIATWDAGAKAADAVEDVGDEAGGAAKKISALSRAVNRMNRLMNRGQALKDFAAAAKAFGSKQSAETAQDFIDNWNTAYSSFKQDSAGQARFVVENYGAMKKAIRNSGVKRSIREQMIDELNNARTAAQQVIDKLNEIDGMTVSVTIQNKLRSGNMPDPSRFATGGYVTGPGTATSDSIPALLSNGEYVLRARAVRALGVGTLNKLNHADKMTDPALLDRMAVTGGQPMQGGGPLIGQIVVHNPARDVDVEQAVLRGMARAERIRKERG